MRDIINSKNSSGKVTVKAKYRDFNEFLGNFSKQEQSEEVKSISSVDSGLSSPKVSLTRSNSSSNSSSEDKPQQAVPYRSYQQFLNSYNTKKYAPVKPNLPEKPKKRSELYITIEPTQPNKEIQKTFVLPKSNQQTHPKPPLFAVSTLPRATKANNYNNCSSRTISPQIQKSLSQWSQEFQSKKMDSEGVKGAPKVDRNDPNVKKLVYSTYRNLLGAYNGKANEMISTLPKEMVRQDEGVKRRVESIALNGGLDKLNGRLHPKHTDNENDQQREISLR